MSVLCEIPLTGAIPTPPPQGAPDVTIRMGGVPQALDDATSSGATWQIGGERFLLLIPGVARFLLTGGREIRFEPDPGVAPEDIAIFLIGTVFGVLLHQRERMVLHASAVRVGDKAVLFCGASGAGKSTIAAALGREGYPLVADDVCAVMFDTDHGPMALPDGRLLKLWSQAIDKLELEGSRGDSVRSRLEKFYVAPDAVFSGPLPLGAVYMLREARPPYLPGIEQPNVVDCALLLRRNAYRPLLVRRMQQKTNYFRAAAAIANSAGIYYVTRTMDFAKMPEVLSGLKDHWAKIGLLQTQAA